MLISILILLKTLLKRAVANSFNAITVDSDQSTNDMVSIFSTRAVKIGQNISLMIKEFKSLNSIKKTMFEFGQTNSCRRRGSKKIYNN